MILVILKMIVLLLFVLVVFLAVKTVSISNSYPQKDMRASVLAFDFLVLAGLAIYLLYKIATW